MYIYIYIYTYVYVYIYTSALLTLYLFACSLSFLTANFGSDDEDMLTPTGYPPPSNTAADTAHSAHSTQPALRPHRATSRVEDKTPADSPAPLNRSMLAPFGGPRPRISAKARGRWFTRPYGSAFTTPAGVVRVNPNPVPAAVCRWGLCPRCPGVGRCFSGVYILFFNY